MIKSGMSSDEEDMEALFRIGNRKIIQPPIQASKEKDEEGVIIIEASSQSSRSGNKQKKIKKDRKQKKQKKQKKEKKEKKEQLLSRSQSSQRMGLDPFAKLQQKVALYSRYEKQMACQLHKDENIMERDFVLKHKLSERALMIDVIRFQTPEIAQFGLQDRQIPFYKRPSNLNTIYGLRRKAKKIRKILKELSMKTNQREGDWAKKEASSYDRYFHFSGYEDLECAQLDKYLNTLQGGTLVDFISFQNSPFHEKMKTHEEKIRTINKEYNIALNNEPKNISIWRKFLSIQDQLFYLTLTATVSTHDQSQQLKIALIDRKLSIIEKALAHNPHSLELSLMGIRLKLQADRERRPIEEDIRKLIQRHSEHWGLWKFYLEFKLANFLDFSHTRLEKDYEEIMEYLLETRMAEAKSGKEVWKIRKCGLLLTAKVIEIHWMSGYHELSTAICSALIEFNILVSNEDFQMNYHERREKFEQYWQNYSAYKLGEYWNYSKTLQPWKGYETTEEGDHIRSFLSNKFCLKKGKSEELFSWLPSHTLHDGERIEKDSRSFVLFEDIKPYLQIYRTKENFQNLTDMFLNNLGLPLAYAHYSETSFGISRINQDWLSSTLLSAQATKMPYHRNSFGLWVRYWHPELSSQILTMDKACKLVYALNVLETLRSFYKQEDNNELYRALKSPLLEYLFFIYGVVFYCPKENTLLSQVISKENATMKIREILAEEPSNPQLWAMYIEIESESGKPAAQCIECFSQWIDGLSVLYPNSDQLQKAKLEAIYWFSAYLKRAPSSLDIATTKSMSLFVLKTITIDKNESFPLEKIVSTRERESGGRDWLKISEMEQLLIGNHLLEMLKHLSKEKDKEAEKSKCFVYYFLLELGQNPRVIIENLLKINSDLSINILLDFGLLDLEMIGNSGLLGKEHIVNNLKFMQYFYQLLIKQCLTLPTFYQMHFKRYCEVIRTPVRIDLEDMKENYQEDQCQNCLYLWLLAMRVYQPHYFTAHSSYYTHYFLTTAREKLVTPFRMSQEPSFIILLNQLLTDPQYAFYCLDKLPFAARLYDVAGLDGSLVRKLESLAMEKEVRGKWVLNDDIE